MKFLADFVSANDSNVSRETYGGLHMNFEPYFKHYEAVVRSVETAFSKLKSEYETCVTCKVGCADCCHALFDLSLIEALYINVKFRERFTGEAYEHILERANDADRQIYRIKRVAYKDHQSGKSESDILNEMAAQRIRCPLLNKDDCCDMYDVRPITCRLYGVPTEIGGQAHTCGSSGFKQGQSYPTVKIEKINKRLYEISFALAHDINSRFPNLAEMLVPLSMALLTDYSMEYLGARDVDDEKQSE
jgi:Fe-S-cluster containining protein